MNKVLVSSCLVSQTGVFHCQFAVNDDVNTPQNNLGADLGMRTKEACRELPYAETKTKIFMLTALLQFLKVQGLDSLM